MEKIAKKKRKRRHKIGDDKLLSIRSRYMELRAKDMNKMDIYCQLAVVYGCRWQCIYNALRRADNVRQTSLFFNN